MEYALWRQIQRYWDDMPDVLILVLMEYALWHTKEKMDIPQVLVLILVLMEYALWLKTKLIRLMAFVES